jgi:hypothetical protein
MRKLMAVIVLGVAVLWASSAWAQYSALGDMPDYGPWLGVGGIIISGDNGAGDSDDTILPTVNLTGITEYLAWQVFYGFNSDTSVIGGNVDYIVANNFDECFTCPGQGMWWFGIGPSFIDATDLYFDENDPSAAIDDSYFGGNLGFGYMWEDWAINLYAHIFEDQYAFQGMILYSFNQ